MKTFLQLGTFVFCAAVISFTYAQQGTPQSGYQPQWSAGQNIWAPAPGGSGALPTGAIVLIDSGSCPAGTTEVAGLNGKTLLGTLSANADIGSTGGADNVIPAGTVSQPTFTGTSTTTSSDSAGTPAGSVSIASVSVNKSNPANQSVDTGVATFTGTAMTGHSHSVTATGTVSQPAFTGTSFDNRSAFERVIFCKAN